MGGTPVSIVGDGATRYALVVNSDGSINVVLGASASIDIGDVTLLAGTAIVGKVGIDQTTPGTTNLVAAGIADGADLAQGALADAVVAAGATGSISAKLRAISRDLVANIVLAAGTALIGRTVADASAATGGIPTTARLASAAASTNGTLAKGSAGRVYQASGKNNAAYDVWLVLYDAITNPPVPGTTTIRKKIVCTAGAAFVYDWPLGLTFATGIGYAFTKLVADADTTVLVAADITGFNLDYA